MEPNSADQPLSHWVALLADPNPSVRAEARRKLETANEAAIPALLTALTDANERIRSEAAWMLSEYNTGITAEVISTLVQSLKDPCFGVRHWIIIAISNNLTKDTAHYVPQIINMLRDRDDGVRRICTYMLQAMSAELLTAPAVVGDRAVKVPAFGSVAQHSETLVGSQLLLEELISTLALKMGHADSYERRSAVISLGRFGTRSLGQLFVFLDESDHEDRMTVVSAINSILEKSLPALLKLLNDPNEMVRRECLIGLKQTVRSPTLMLSHVRHLLRDSSADVRFHAVSLIGELGQDAHPALYELIELLSDDSNMVRHWAASVVAGLKPSAENRQEVEEMLHEKLQDPTLDEYVREQIAKAIEGLGGVAGAESSKPRP